MKTQCYSYIQKYKWNSADKFEFEYELEMKDDKTGVAFVRDMRHDRFGQKIWSQEITCKT